ncbi:M-phase phosphoprotein 8-like isoform X1 [Dreissena polymorpha]|nr:M-phase phosphoprotein 8-like isoform X1 [Dreissena polymorpha]
MADGKARMGDENDVITPKLYSHSESEPELFEVERILGKIKTNGKVQYKIRWKGFGPEEDTWEPTKNLASCQDLIEEFERKQTELAKKRSEERKMKQLLMEGRIDSSESSEDTNSPYPANFKNTFWKELEAGRVNVFDNDMYSKVKSKRASSKAKSSNDNNDKDRKTDKRGNNSDSKGDFSKKNKNQTCGSTSEPCSKSGRTSTPKNRSRLRVISNTSESEDIASRAPRLFSASDTSDTDSVKGALNIIIKKIPHIASDTSESESLQTSPAYSVQSKDTGKGSKSKKKKHHKHHKHKKDRGASSPKRRKLSQKSEIENQHCADITDEHDIDSVRDVLATPRYDSEEIHEFEDSNECNLESMVLSESMATANETHSGKSSASEFFVPKNVDLSLQVSSNGSQLIDLPINNAINNSVHFDQKDFTNTNTSLNNNNNKNNNYNSCSDNKNQHDQISDSGLFSSFTDSMLSQPFCRQNSDTVDSGVYSPMSDKSNMSLQKQSGFAGAILPILSDEGKNHSRESGNDLDLELELDDLDWDLFDTEVTMEPVNISDEEFSAAVWQGDYALVKRALFGDRKYSLEARDENTCTLLMHSVQHGHDDISNLLVDNGADINARSHNGWTPLMFACQTAGVSTVNLLLELGAPVNVAAVDGVTPLIVAARRGHAQIFWLLLECGANFNTVTHARHSALEIVRALFYTDLENVLNNHIHRVMSAFDKQVSITLNETASIVSALFPAQIFNVCEGSCFQFAFHHSLLPPNSGVGNLLFIAQAEFTSEDVKCRLYGPCAVKSVCLNGQPLAQLTESGNFVMAFSPLVGGRNIITINTATAKGAKSKLIMCAYKTQLLQV